MPTLIAQLAPTSDPTLAPRIWFWTAMAVWGVLEVRTAIRRSGTDTGEDAGSQRWSLGGTLGGLLAALIIDEVMPEVVAESRHGPFLIAGGVLVLAGVALRIWSIRTLGRFFTYQVMTTADQHVVSHGPYRWVRHPSYSALLVSVVGAGVATANPVSLPVAVVIALVGLMRRISVEEAALARRMGDDYRAFAASRKRLVPGIW
jgi:protein-S-isoprenylcysteine O-methyltransferase Ste14